MGRYIGPVEKLARREGVSLDLTGKRQLLGKTSLERRGPVPPGQHGAARRRTPSVYGQQVDHEALTGRVLRAPRRAEIAMPVNEQLVIERYARR